MRERVTKRIICCAEGFADAHQVDYESCRGNEEYLHERVVDADEIHEEIEVANTKHD